MKKNYTLFLILLTYCLFSTNTFATKFYSNNNGNWTDGNTWNNSGAVPSSNDTVYINSHSITLNTNVNIKRIEITNTVSTFNSASLTIKESAILTVAEDILMTSENHFKNTDLLVIETATLIVNGNVSLIRTTNNNQATRLYFFLSGNSETYILGDLLYDYKNAGSMEFSNDIHLSENALLDITGQTTLICRGGENLDFVAEGSSQVILRDSLSVLTYGGDASRITSDQSSTIEIYGNTYMLNSNPSGGETTRMRSGTSGGNIILYKNLYMESTLERRAVAFEVNGSTSNGSVRGNISMTAIADSSVYVNIINNGELKLGGTILRPSGYGALKMDENSQITFNGTEAQSIPSSHLLDAASNKDSLYFTGISFENTSGSPITLQNDLIIQDTLFLKSGNIISSPSALVIIEEDAIILGGNNTAYIEGPVLKKGSISESEFTFPIGDANAYAPLSISNTNFESSQYTAQYAQNASDPPPFGVIYLTGGMTNVSEIEYWTLEKSVGSKDVDVKLHWDDAEASGISDLSSLVVAGYDSVDDEWDNYGNGGTTGTTGANESGTIINSLASDPPPFGVIYFTFGTTSAINALPVELTSFQAVQQNSHVYLEWATASERNTSHFSIERSINGIDFKEIGIVSGSGDGLIAKQYTSKDIAPASGINYYRLKIIDHDNSFEYSNIEVVIFDATPTIQLYPNPVGQTIQLEGFDLGTDNVHLEIIDRNGKLIFSNNVSVKDGRLQISTDLAKIKYTGTYFLRVISQQQSHIFKMIKID
ncbi:MAG: T9SS type A sorting domain-containing protein [Saprospiraceae bacterium]